MANVINKFIGLFKKKPPKNLNEVKRWHFKFNMHQIAENVLETNDRVFGIPGEEVWAEEVGYYEYDWEKGSNAWRNLRYTGRYWHGAKPEEEGREMSEQEFKKNKAKYDAFYDTESPSRGMSQA